MKWIKSTEGQYFEECNNFADKKGEELTLGDAVGRGVYGFGCAISEVCARAVLGLPKEKQKEIFGELFGQNESGFNYCRLAVGANDFVDNWYSYDEVDGDYELKNFSIDRDRKYIIPFVKEAQKYSPDLFFCASPWSPPTWMKTPKIMNGGILTETPENLTAYAKYLRKFVDEYKNEGITVKHLSFQNEFSFRQVWPSCVFNAKQAENFLANYLIDEIGDAAEVWYGTVNHTEDQRWEDFFHNYLLGVLENEKCRKGIKGASFQWIGRSVITRAYDDLPDMDFVCSEIECRSGYNNWNDALYMFSNMRHYFRYGARANVYWNMALPAGGKSTWLWSQNSLITVDGDGYKFNNDYYVYKHFAKFIKRGAKFIETKGRYSTCCAFFKNPDGQKVGVMLNPFDHEITVSLEGNNFVLTPKSVNTVIL